MSLTRFVFTISVKLQNVVSRTQLKTYLTASGSGGAQASHRANNQATICNLETRVAKTQTFAKHKHSDTTNKRAAQTSAMATVVAALTSSNTHDRNRGSTSRIVVWCVCFSDVHYFAYAPAFQLKLSKTAARLLDKCEPSNCCQDS